MDTLVEQLLESPKLPEILDEMQRHMAEERARRRRFYEEIDESQKAEFINGQVIIQSPAKEMHLAARENLHQLMRTFVQLRGLGVVRGEKALCVFPRNDYEPDVCFFGTQKTALITPDTLRFPIPDFIAEVLSDSTENKDRGEKFDDYQAHGVGEYWLIDPGEEVLEQYILKGARYELTQKSGTGEARSVVVKDFCIPIRALFDTQLNLRVLAEILNAPRP